MRSRCQGDREADVEKAFTRAHAEWKYTRTKRVPCELGGSMPRASWVESVPSELGREADIDKAFTRAHVEWKHTRTQTNWRQMETRSQICFIYVCIDYWPSFYFLSAI